MKIAIFIDQFSPGATPKWTSIQTKHFRKLGHDTEILAIVSGGLEKGSYHFNEFLDDVPIRYLSQECNLLNILNFKLPMFAFLSAYHFASAILVPHIIKEKEYDIVIAHAGLTCLIAQRLWKRRGIPYLALNWDPMSYILPKVYGPRLPKRLLDVLTSFAKHLDKSIIDESIATLTSSQIHADSLRTLSVKHVDVLYPGCSPVEVLPKVRGDYMLAIDRWDVGNMPHVLLDVWERLPKKIELRIAGFWWPESLHKSFIEKRDKKGLKDWVKILGSVTEEELSRLYLNARALLFPIPVTINMVVLEAAGHGCPVIMPIGIEFFKHGIHGLFTTEGNIDQYAEYVNRLASDERLAWQLGYNGWNISRKHTWDHHVKKLENMVTTYMDTNYTQNTNSP